MNEKEYIEALNIAMDKLSKVDLMLFSNNPNLNDDKFSEIRVIMQKRIEYILLHKK